MMFRAMAAMFLMGLSACTGTDKADSGVESGGGAASVPTWHQDVRPIIETSCAGCHTDGGIGGFSLETYGDVSVVADAVADSVANRRMPPWKAVDGCNDYQDDITLSEGQIATIVAWADGDTPVGDEAAARTGTPPATGSLERVDLTVSLPLPYEVNTDQPDDYRCFPVDWPLEEDAYVTGYVVKPGRADLVHHMIAYIVPGSYAEALATLEAEDGSPGYSCFGGPGGVDQQDAAWLGAWAPGAVQGSFPNGIGLSMKADDILVLQMHYNNTSGGVGTDQSSIDFQIEAEVEREGWIQPFTNPLWVFSGGMEIPAGEDGVAHSFGYAMPRALTFYTASLHMHTLGKTARMEIERPDGTKDCLLEIDDWDFDWQRTYGFSEPVSLQEGDVWHLSCTWDNPTDQDVDWGEGTGDEMCLGTALVTLD